MCVTVIFLNGNNAPLEKSDYYLDVVGKEVQPVAIRNHEFPMYQGKDVKRLAKAWGVSYVDALERFVAVACDDSGREYYALRSGNTE